MHDAQMIRRSASMLYYAGLISSGKFVRDYGTHTELINLEGCALKEHLEERLLNWQKEADQLTSVFRELGNCKKKTLLKENENLVTEVATVERDMLKKVCREWKEIALVCRDKEFQKEEQEDIDMFDIKCKEWGFLLKELFGASLGTGDYGHLTIDHAPMLMRRFLSMKEFSQQGFEASHKDQRQLWQKATFHDCRGESSSIEQMLVHFYTEKLLFLRYCFREAVRVIQGKLPQQNSSFRLHFRGCGWKPKTVAWTKEEQVWIKLMNNLMTMMFGGDYYEYYYNEKKVCLVDEESQPEFHYHREEWNRQFNNIISEGVPRNVKGGVSFNKRKLQAEKDLGYSHTGGEPVPLKQPKLIDLDSEDKNDLAVNQGNGQYRVIAAFPPPPSRNRVTILQMDIDTLEDGKELNDAIIDFCVLYTLRNAPDTDVIDKCHVFSSFFYTKLVERVKDGSTGTFVLPSPEERHARSSSFTRNVGCIFEKEFLFIPVCRSGHWFMLLVYNLPQLKTSKKNCGHKSFIFVIDSIVWSNGSVPSPREHEAEMIRSFLRCEWVAKRGSSIDITDTSLPLVYPKVPQQENGYDCGVFVLLFFEEFITRKFPVNQLLTDEELQWYNQSSALRLRTKLLEIIFDLERIAS